MLFFVTIKADLDFFFFLELFSGEKKDFISYFLSPWLSFSFLSLSLHVSFALSLPFSSLSHTTWELLTQTLTDRIGAEDPLSLSLSPSLTYSLTHTHTTWEYQDGRELGSTHSHSRSLGVEQTTFATDSDDWKCLTPHNWMKGRISGPKCSWNAKSII